MTIKTFTYVDNSNLFIEGRRVAAVRNGAAANIREALEFGIFDFSWQLDYGRLHEFVSGDAKTVGAANLWGSPPPGDSFWKMVESKGFKVQTYERSRFTGREKQVDAGIIHNMTKDAYKGHIPRSDSEIVLVAGDRDYVETITDLKSEGFRIVVVFWQHATSPELQAAASEFIDLTPHHNHLSW